MFVLFSDTFFTKKNMRGCGKRFAFWFAVTLGVSLFVGLDYAVYECFQMISDAMKKFHIGDICKLLQDL